MVTTSDAGFLEYHRQAGSRAALRASSPRMRVALAQVDVVPGDYDANLPRIKRIIDEQRGQADLLVFPEYTFSGYQTGQAVYDSALRVDDAIFQELVAATQGITVAIGFIEETGAFNFYDSLAFIRDGKVVGIHRKIYLVNYGAFEERKYFSVGPRHQSLHLDDFRLTPFICADVWNPALVHLAGSDRAHIFVFSAASPTQGLGSRLSTRESWHRMNQFYASMYRRLRPLRKSCRPRQRPRVLGRQPDRRPLRPCHSRRQDRDEDIVTAELDLAEVREARTVLHTVRDEDLRFIRRRLDDVLENNYSTVEAQNL